MNNESQLALIDKEFKKKYGGNYRGLGSEEVYEPIPRVPIICPSLNKILGDGMPIGRIIEVFGQPSHGKTTLAYHIIKSFQKHCPERLALFIDAEHSFAPDYAEKCGVDMDKFCILSPDNAQEALDGIRSGLSLINENSDAEKPESVFSIIVLDSVAGLVPSDEYTKDVGGGMIGALARLMSSVVKQLIALADKYNTTIIFLNQERSCNMTGLNLIKLCHN